MSDLSPVSSTITGDSSPADAHVADARVRELSQQNAADAVADVSLEMPQESACPPPLVWQEVIAAYRAESTPWEIARGSRRLVGRMWGEGPPLYLLNGFAATAEMYALMMWLLRDSFRCVVFDSVPTKRSWWQRPSMTDFASDVIAVADRHGDSKIHLYGATFGAAVALQAAVDYPERVLAMALQHGFARRRLSLSERCLARCCRLTRRQLSSLPIRRRIQEMNHRRWFPPFDGTRFEFLVETTGSIPLSDLADKALAVHAFDLEGRLGDVACPALLIRTEGQGRKENEGHDSLERGLKQARTEPLHSTGLHPCLTHPHRVAKLLKSFFPGEQPSS
jgi:pimeloyl-ACP methyl ester carboxylesterase